MNPKIKELLKTVETLRRKKEDYEEFGLRAFELSQLLSKDPSPEATEIRIKLDYEFVVSASDWATDALLRAQTLAQETISTAARNRNVIGKLFVEVVLAGHILPALRKGSEAVEMLSDVFTEAEKLLANVPTENDRKRLQRVAMNCCWHQVLLGIEYNADPREVARWLTSLKANGLFWECEKTKEGKQVLAAAERFLSSKT